MGYLDIRSYREYNLKILTVSFPSLFRNLPPRLVLAQTSITSTAVRLSQLSFSERGRQNALNVIALYRLSVQRSKLCAKRSANIDPSLAVIFRATDSLWQFE